MKIVVIGGVAAGMSAAAKAVRENRQVKVVVYTEEEYVSYGSCGFPYFIGDVIKEAGKLTARSMEDFRKNGIEINPGCKAMKIDPDKSVVLIRENNTGNEFEVSYDSLVIATGARAFIPPLEGLELANVFSLRSIPDAVKIKEYITQAKPRRGVIVGGGYIGLEMAEAFREHGMETTVVEMAPQLVPNMDEDMADLVEKELIGQGVTVLKAEQVIKLAGTDQVSAVVTDQREIPCDIVLLAIGVQPNSEIAAAAGIELGPKRAIRVNKKGQTSHPQIYAAGDCASVFHLLYNDDVYIPLGTTANKQGRVAGENAAGGNTEFPGVVGSGIAKVFNLEIARTGLTAREAKMLNRKFFTQTVQALNHAHYYPGAQPIHIKVTVEQDTGKLLGAQIVGGPGAGKRIDVFATALYAGLNVDQIGMLDLAYAPPFSPVWDSILVAANAARRK